jgi:hypothetical protein
MNELFDSLNRLLSDVILPNLKSVQVSQAEQIAVCPPFGAVDRLPGRVGGRAGGLPIGS